MARKMWRSLEPCHALVYFAPEATPAYQALGLDALPMGYFASRAAPMGAVEAEVVIATFFNFAPDLVRSCIPEAWRRATPEQILGARLQVADGALRRLLGDTVDSEDVAEAAELAREATVGLPAAGRPLFGGHASLPWPEPAHLQLWHAISLLREFRGDGHIAALVVAGFEPCQALVLHGASGEVPVGVLRATRAWPDDAWEAAERELRERGWLAGDGTLTDDGRRARDDVEDRTDALAMVPWERLGPERCDRLRELVKPLSRTIAGNAPAAPPRR